MVAFYIVIDVTKVSTGLETSSGYKSLISRPYPGQFLSIKGLSSEEIEALSKGSDLASEANTAVIIVQNDTEGLSPVSVVATRP